MLLQIHDKERLAIMPLWRLIFRFTFEKKNCPHTIKKTIEDQLLKWNSFIQINKARELEKYGLDPEMEFVPVGKKGSILDEFEYQLGLMCSWVVREEKGEFQSKIDAYGRAKIDYRLVEPMCKVFPECAANRNVARGHSHLLQNIKDFPDIYKHINKVKGK